MLFLAQPWEGFPPKDAGPGEDPLFTSLGCEIVPSALSLPVLLLAELPLQIPAGVI